MMVLLDIVIMDILYYTDHLRSNKHSWIMLAHLRSNTYCHSTEQTGPHVATEHLAMMVSTCW